MRLHVQRRRHRLGRVAKDHHVAVALDLQQDAVIGLDDWKQHLLRGIHHLQKVQDAEIGNVTGKAGQVREHDRPSLPKEVPDALVDGVSVGARLAAFGHQGGQPLF